MYQGLIRILSVWLLGFPQGFVLGPLLFMLVNDLISFMYETDYDNLLGTTPCKFYPSTDLVKELPEIKFNLCLSWFQSNGLVADPGKFQLIFLGTNDYVVYSMCIAML